METLNQQRIILTWYRLPFIVISRMNFGKFDFSAGICANRMQTQIFVMKIKIIATYLPSCSRENVAMILHKISFSENSIKSYTWHA